MQIEIHAGEIQMTATLNNTHTAQRIAAGLPLEGSGQVWGDEIFFTIPVKIALDENAVEEVDVGTLAYWPTGSAFCIFFGPTPASTSHRPRAYSPENVFGKINGDATVLKQLTNGTPVRVTPRKTTGQ